MLLAGKSALAEVGILQLVAARALDCFVVRPSCPNVAVEARALLLSRLCYIEWHREAFTCVYLPMLVGSNAHFQQQID